MFFNEAHIRILTILRDGGEMFGIDIVRADPKNLKMGSVYVHLLNLQHLGDVGSRLVEKPSEDEREALPRRKYSITPGGRKRLIEHEAQQGEKAHGNLQGA